MDLGKRAISLSCAASVMVMSAGCGGSSTSDPQAMYRFGYDFTDGLIEVDHVKDVTEIRQECERSIDIRELVGEYAEWFLHGCDIRTWEEGLHG